MPTSFPALHGLGTAWLTSAGVAAVVVGMAAQNTLGNLIAGVSLVLYRPFHLGDQLQVSAPSGLETGIVENISLGYTILRTGDERRLVIPNNLMASQTIVNLSMSSQPVPCARRHYPGTRCRCGQGPPNPPRGRPAEFQGARHTRLPHHQFVRRGHHRHADGVGGQFHGRADMKSDLLEGAKKQLDQAGIKIHRDAFCGARKIAAIRFWGAQVPIPNRTGHALAEPTPMSATGRADHT